MVESKSELMDVFKFKSIMFVYAQSAADYNTKKNKFLMAAENVKVRVNKKYILLVDQFLSNWDSCNLQRDVGCISLMQATYTR